MLSEDEMRRINTDIHDKHKEMIRLREEIFWAMAPVRVAVQVHKQKIPYQFYYLHRYKNFKNVKHRPTPPANS